MSSKGWIQNLELKIFNQTSLIELDYNNLFFKSYLPYKVMVICLERFIYILKKTKNKKTCEYLKHMTNNVISFCIICNKTTQIELLHVYIIMSILREKKTSATKSFKTFS